MGFGRNNFENFDSVEDDVTLPEPEEQNDFDYEQWEADLETEDYDEFATDRDLGKDEDEPETGDEPDDDFVNDIYNPDAVEVDSQDPPLKSPEADERDLEPDDFKDDLYDPDGVDVDEAAESGISEVNTVTEDPGEKDFTHDVYDHEGYYDNSAEHGGEDSSVPGEKRFEDYSSEELGELARTDPETARALNEKYQERVSAERLGMTPEEYRAHLQRIKDANNDDTSDRQSSETKNDIVSNNQEKIEVLNDNSTDLDDPDTSEKKVNRESEHWAKHGEMCKTAFDNASSVAEKDKYGNDYKELNQSEKQALSSDMKNHIDCIPKGERGNYRVPEPEKIKGVSQTPDGKFQLVENWKANCDGAKDGTREMEVVKAKDANGSPTYIDRIGSGNGNYFSPMNEYGEPYSLRERAIGDYLPEKNIEDNDSYHKYEVKQDFTRENFEAAIDKTYTDPDINAKKHRELEAYYKDASFSYDTNGHDGEAYRFIGDNPNGVKSGEIDNMFGTKENPDGGGKQYITPFKARELEEMGMIEEVKKEDYR